MDQYSNGYEVYSATRWFVLHTYEEDLMCFIKGLSFLYHCQDFDRTWLYIWVTRTCLPFASIWLHLRFFGGVRGAHLFSFVYCPIMRVYVLSSVLWCPLRFPHKKRCSVRHYPQLFVGCLIYVICVCLPIVVFNTYCAVYFVWFVFFLCAHP